RTRLPEVAFYFAQAGKLVPRLAPVRGFEPSLTDPNTAYAGAEDAALFKTTDGGKSWNELSGLRKVKGNLWQPGAGGMAVHTILLDPKNEKRIYVAISAGGCFRTDEAERPGRRSRAD